MERRSTGEAAARGLQPSPFSFKAVKRPHFDAGLPLQSASGLATLGGRGDSGDRRPSDDTSSSASVDATAKLPAIGGSRGSDMLEGLETFAEVAAASDFKRNSSFSLKPVPLYGEGEEDGTGYEYQTASQRLL